MNLPVTGSLAGGEASRAVPGGIVWGMLKRIKGTITALLRTRMITAPSESCFAECRSAVFRLFVARAVVKNLCPVRQNCGGQCSHRLMA